MKLATVNDKHEALLEAERALRVAVEAHHVAASQPAWRDVRRAALRYAQAVTRVLEPSPPGFLEVSKASKFDLGPLVEVLAKGNPFLQDAPAGKRRRSKR